MIEFERYFKVLEQEEDWLVIEYYNKKMEIMGQDTIKGRYDIDFELDAVISLGIIEVK